MVRGASGEVAPVARHRPRRDRPARRGGAGEAARGAGVTVPRGRTPTPAHGGSEDHRGASACGNATGTVRSTLDGSREPTHRSILENASSAVRPRPPRRIRARSSACSRGTPVEKGLAASAGWSRTGSCRMTLGRDHSNHAARWPYHRASDCLLLVISFLRTIGKKFGLGHDPYTRSTRIDYDTRVSGNRRSGNSEAAGTGRGFATLRDIVRKGKPPRKVLRPARARSADLPRAGRTVRRCFGQR